MKNNSSTSRIKRYASDILIREVLDRSLMGKDAYHCQTFGTPIFCEVSKSKIKQLKTAVPNEEQF